MCIITSYLVGNVTVNVSVSQGDDSLSVITCESDTEMVSFINGMLWMNALKGLSACSCTQYIHVMPPGR